MLAAADQLSLRTMASCYSCCVHSLPGPIVPFVLVSASICCSGVFCDTEHASFAESLSQVQDQGYMQNKTFAKMLYKYFSDHHMRWQKSSSVLFYM